LKCQAVPTTALELTSSPPDAFGVGVIVSVNVIEAFSVMCSSAVP